MCEGVYHLGEEQDWETPPTHISRTSHSTSFSDLYRWIYDPVSATALAYLLHSILDRSTPCLRAADGMSKWYCHFHLSFALLPDLVPFIVVFVVTNATFFFFVTTINWKILRLDY